MVFPYAVLHYLPPVFRATVITPRVPRGRTTWRAYLVAGLAGLVVQFAVGCAVRGASALPDAGTAKLEMTSKGPPSQATGGASSPQPGAGASSDKPSARSTASAEIAGSPRAAPRVVRFAWKPPAGGHRGYAMRAEEDQHRIVLGRGVGPGKHPVVLALHGQPARGQRPRDYAFPEVVATAVLDLLEREEVMPLVLVTPVFRFEGENWPRFDLVAFSQELSRLLGQQGITPGPYYLFGHSGAAGCGGEGLNRAHRLGPAAVGFFDTCLGPGWRSEVSALQKAGIPTRILHSVETAGFVPRQAREYQSTFDFGKAYAPLGLAPAACPAHLPEVPLREQRYRCAANADGLVRALVVDTGEGQEAHDALVPVAVRYFLREFLPRHRS